MPEAIRVMDVNDRPATAQVSRFSGFPDTGICGFRDEWQPGVLHVVSFNDSRPHHHEDMEEVFLVLEGTGNIVLGGKWIAVRKWDTVRVPRGVEHFGVPDSGDKLVVAVFFLKNPGPSPEPTDCSDQV